MQHCQVVASVSLHTTATIDFCLSSFECDVDEYVSLYRALGYVFVLHVVAKMSFLARAHALEMFIKGLNSLSYMQDELLAARSLRPHACPEGTWEERRNVVVAQRSQDVARSSAVASPFRSSLVPRSDVLPSRRRPSTEGRQARKATTKACLGPGRLKPIAISDCTAVDRRVKEVESGWW